MEPVNLQDGGTAALSYWYTRVSRLCCGLFWCSLSAGIFALCIPAFSLWVFLPFSRNPPNTVSIPYCGPGDTNRWIQINFTPAKCFIKKKSHAQICLKTQIRTSFLMITLCSKVLKTLKIPFNLIFSKLPPKFS